MVDGEITGATGANLLIGHMVLVAECAQGQHLSPYRHGQFTVLILFNLRRGVLFTTTPASTVHGL